MEEYTENLEHENVSEIPTYRKYTMGIEEAARYYGIGEKRLRRLVAEHPIDDFYLEVGKKILLKRVKFEEFLDNAQIV